ncbi:MAG: hypothetical protein QMD36_03390 [Candidatus Aenigmarchaeota archaeon]|nr:hypothetical protein [Candidatus Aenigmarchaeota archaeon]
MKKILFIATLATLFLITSVISTTIYVRPGKLIVHADDYPNATSVVYNLTLRNDNEFPVIVSFVKSGNIQTLITILEDGFTMEPAEMKDVGLEISLTGPATASGTITVGFTPSEGQGMPVTYGVDVTIYGRGGGTTKKCAGTKTSCGTYPDCKDLTKLDGCYNGYKRSYYCSNNQPKYSESCTDYCCQQFYGSVGKCQSGVCKGQASPPPVKLVLNITNGLGGTRSAKITLYIPGTSTIVNTSTINGYGTIHSSNSTVDFMMEFDSSILIVLLKSLNLTKLSGTSQIIIDVVPTSIPNVSLIKAYKISIPSTFSFTGIILKIKYSTLSFGNEQGLAIYKCGSYNDLTNVCNDNWVKISATRDTVNDIISAELSSFSVYALGESQQTTTTTTTLQTTTTQSSSSSSRSSGGTTTTTTIPETQGSLTCSDDDGTNYENKGTCTLDGSTYTDFCSSNTALREFYCSDSICAMEEKDCDAYCKEKHGQNQTGTCSQGACVCKEIVIVEEVKEEGKKPTGLFIDILGASIASNAFTIGTVVVLASFGIFGWRYQDRLKQFFTSTSHGKSKGSYSITRETPRVGYVEIKPVKKEIEQPKEQPRAPPIGNDVKNKVIEEIRKRAIEEDRKFK